MCNDSNLAAQRQQFGTEKIRQWFRSARNPLKQRKISDMDIRSLSLWDDYTEAKKTMFAATDTKTLP